MHSGVCAPAPAANRNKSPAALTQCQAKRLFVARPAARHKASVKRCVAWAAQVNPHKALRLLRLYPQIVWSAAAA